MDNTLLASIESSLYSIRSSCKQINLNIVVVMIMLASVWFMLLTISLRISALNRTAEEYLRIQKQSLKVAVQPDVSK